MGNGNLQTLNEVETVPNLPSGTYLVTINDEFGNQTILIQELSQPPALDVTINTTKYGPYDLSCFQENDGQISLIPFGGTAPYNYLWEDNSRSNNRQGLTQGNYGFTITDAQNCALIDSVMLNEPSPIMFTSIANSPNCDGPNTGSIQVETLMGGLAPYFININNRLANNSASFENLSAGDYTIIVTDANGCTESEMVQLNAPIIPIIDLVPNITISLGNETLLTPTVIQGVAVINWRPDSTLSCLDCPTPSIRPLNRQSYQLTVQSIDDCLAMDSINVNVLKTRRVYSANVFSPNNDGINDQFYLQTGPEVSTIQSFQIFTRWGEKVYGRQNFSPNEEILGWDGTFRNQNVENGVYFWQATIQFIDGEQERYSGDVTLLP